jgi:hypothetical protein
MRQNTNLVPTVITDVNGKTTTVHRKPAKVSASSSSIPKPSGGGREALVKDTARLAREMCSHSLSRMIISTDLATITEALNGISDGTLRTIHDYLASKSENEAVLHFLKELYDNKDEGRLRSYIFASGVVGDQTELSFYEITAMSCGAAKALGAPTGFEDANEETLQSAGALIRVTEQIYLTVPSDEADRSILERSSERGSETIEVINPELKEVVLGNLERTDDIVSFIADRDTANPELLREFLNDGTALAEGVL